MKLKSILFALILCVSVSQLAFAHDGENHEGEEPEEPTEVSWDSTKVAKASHQLEEMVKHLHEVLEKSNDPALGHLAEDAHKLEQALAHFHKVVHDGETLEHATQDYRKLKRSLIHVVRMIRHIPGNAIDPHVTEDTQKVILAYQVLSYTWYISNLEANGKTFDLKTCFDSE